LFSDQIVCCFGEHDRFQNVIVSERSRVHRGHRDQLRQRSLHLPHLLRVERRAASLDSNDDGRPLQKT
jgi:hypothetical protein